MLVLAAVPGIVAILIAAALLGQTEIPYSAANFNDKMELEYSKHKLKSVSFGVTDRIVSEKSQVLDIKQNGDATYVLIENGQSKPPVRFQLDERQMLRLVAFVKETGISSIPAESLSRHDGLKEYEKSVLRITLNGKHSEITWTQHNATEFIPPIITQMEAELAGLIRLAER